MIRVPPTHDSVKAKIARAAAPSYGYCGRCGMPWNRVDGHTTWYSTCADGSPKRGCFPLCEACWALLGSPEARIEYYASLIDQWDADKLVDDETRRAIGRAVANEGANA